MTSLPSSPPHVKTVSRKQSDFKCWRLNSKLLHVVSEKELNFCEAAIANVSKQAALFVWAEQLPALRGCGGRHDWQQQQEQEQQP